MGILEHSRMMHDGVWMLVITYQSRRADIIPNAILARTGSLKATNRPCLGAKAGRLERGLERGGGGRDKGGWRVAIPLPQVQRQAWNDVWKLDAGATFWTVHERELLESFPFTA